MILYFGNIELLLLKKVYIYLDDNISSAYAKKMKKLLENFVDSISKYKDYTLLFLNKSNENISKKIILLNMDNINIFNSLNINFNSKNNLNTLLIFLLYKDQNYSNFFLSNILDKLIIPEAKYKKEIIDIVNICLDTSKEIYVTPSNITNKNAVFSNYLIKQGANVILNKYDILK